jgi:hypothetical protein
VIQAQRDLAQAKANELGAVLAYDLALVDFEALQQAGPRRPVDGERPAAAADTSGRATGDTSAWRRTSGGDHGNSWILNLVIG